ncbi:MAG: hypothetical protein IKZ87_02570 [Actinomycetaceae bacterium]|nr:hypothetical protein [Actinomycetaceae bacterium]
MRHDVKSNPIGDVRFSRAFYSGEFISSINNFAHDLCRRELKGFDFDDVRQTVALQVWNKYKDREIDPLVFSSARRWAVCREVAPELYDSDTTTQLPVSLDVTVDDARMTSIVSGVGVDISRLYATDVDDSLVHPYILSRLVNFLVAQVGLDSQACSQIVGHAVKTRLEALKNDSQAFYGQDGLKDFSQWLEQEIEPLGSSAVTWWQLLFGSKRAREKSLWLRMAGLNPEEDMQVLLDGWTKRRIKTLRDVTAVYGLSLVVEEKAERLTALTEVSNELKEVAA